MGDVGLGNYEGGTYRGRHHMRPASLKQRGQLVLKLLLINSGTSKDMLRLVPAILRLEKQRINRHADLVEM